MKVSFHPVKSSLQQVSTVRSCITYSSWYMPILDNGFCDTNSTTNKEFGGYTWPETSVGDTHRVQCAFGPPNTDAQRDCLSREERQWSDIIDYSDCYTMITMMYQVFEVVSMIINSHLRFVKNCSCICRRM